ncbi:hypothetical protein [Clostridium ljungdahlii]|uniref:Uncharacterized protein n=1 Tax=Clostridium ljungdahlii (strain ATCC 55383 / DSM 13528 / PETC) TaxID=748727 RepID=D8GU89_CLOLD|nr:hypothetical protein [Clostridium ljungdahlii]ADK14752.1 hypothetical protein CLJU_c16880 [Clostridium ljungdahlii DSM 13528]OAA84109.1 hypothetical protein WX45_01953 [Clostridium ljungdahlii DSM 13528]
MDINELKNIKNDGLNKENIIKQIKEYCKEFYGEPLVEVSGGGINNNSQIKKYYMQRTTYINKIKLDFKKFFEHNIPNFKIQNKDNEIVARVNNKNNINIIFQGIELIFLEFNIDNNDKKFNESYTIEIRSDFKKPSQSFKADKTKNYWGRTIRCTGFTLDKLDNQTTSALNSALNEIKEVVEYNDKIKNNIKFLMDVYKEKSYDNLLFSSQSIEQVIQQIIKEI